MIYLIFKMALYLLIALATGAGAGWLIRNLSAVKQEEELQRAANEVKAKLPQIESLMRSRDEQLTTLRSESKDKDARIGELRNELSVQSKALKSVQGQLKEAQALRDSAQGSETLPATPENADRVAELMAEVGRLHSQLSDARVRAAASELTRDDGSTDEEQLRGELQDLEAKLKQNRQQQDRTSQVLEQERRKVVELERERELQSKSLQLLHQQLDMERERAPAGR